MLYVGMVIIACLLTAALASALMPVRDPDEAFLRRVERDQELRAAHDWYVETYGRAPTAAELWDVVPPTQ